MKVEKIRAAIWRGDWKRARIFALGSDEWAYCDQHGIPQFPRSIEETNWGHRDCRYDGGGGYGYGYDGYGGGGYSGGGGFGFGYSGGGGFDGGGFGYGYGNNNRYDGGGFGFGYRFGFSYDYDGFGGYEFREDEECF